MRNPLQLTSMMLASIEDKAKIVNTKLPKNIYFTIFVFLNPESNMVTLILATNGNRTIDNYLKHSTSEIKKMIEHATNLNWEIIENNQFMLDSGYVVFFDDDGIEEFHKIEGCEYHFDSIYLNGKETSLPDMQEKYQWEMDLAIFDFEREIKYNSQIERN